MKNTFFILSAVCLWGIISIFINALSGMGFQPMQCVALRTVLTALLLFIWLILRDREKLKISLKDTPLFLGTRLCSIVFFNYCYFKAIQITGSSAVPALLLYTAPAFVMLISAVLFREKINTVKIAALAVTLFGLFLVTGTFSGGEQVSARVIFLGLGAGLGYALYSILGKLTAEKYDAATITFYTFLTAAAGAVLIAGLTETWPPFQAECLLPALGMALLSTVLPFLLYTKGLSGMDAGRAAILASVEPFTAAAVGAVIFHEEFTIYKTAGMICIVFAIVLLNLNGTCKKRRRKKI